MKYVITAIMLGGLLFTSGCAFSDVKLDVEYDKNLAKAGPLASVNSLKVNVSEFTDKRLLPDRVGDVRNGYGAHTADIITNKPVVDVVRNAIADTFEINGHVVTDVNPDIVISGDIERFWFESQANFWTIEFMGTIDVNLSVSDAASNNTIFSKRYSGHNNEEMYVGYDKEMHRVLNAALDDLMFKIGMDSQLADALKSAD